MSIWDNFFYTMLSTSTPIILAALGGIMTRQVGMFNLGLEGMMTVAAFVSVYLTSITGNLAAGLFGGIAATVLLGLFMAFISIRLKADIFVVGIAANALGTGLTTFLGLLLTGMQGTMVFKKTPVLPAVVIPYLKSIPVLGPFLSGHTVIDYLSIILPVVLSFVIFRTAFGYHARAAGLNARVAENCGISVVRHQYIAYVWCGIFCGLAGASMSMPIAMYAGGLIGMTNGRGWTAMAVVILSAGNPVVALLASWVLGAISALGNVLQTNGVFSSRLVMAFPFLAALIGTAVYSCLQKRKGSLNI